jgi:hypothetical protein
MGKRWNGKSFLAVSLVLFVFVSIIGENKNVDPVKLQKERVLLLEQAKTSTDPAVRKQAEIIRSDINRDYQSYKKEKELEEKVELGSKEFLEQLFKKMSSVSFSVFLSLVIVALIASGKLFAVYRDERR